MVIGVLVSLTIPSIMTQIRDQQLVKMTKKQYSVLQQMVKKYQADTGNDYSGLFNPKNTSYQTLQEMAKYLNVAKVCTGNTGCWNHKTKYANPYNDGYGNYNTYKTGLSASAILADGSTISVLQFGGTQDCIKTLTNYKKDENGNYLFDASGNRIPYEFQHGNCADIMFDVNGPKPPNQFGADTFYMVVRPNELRPYIGESARYGNLTEVLVNGKLSYTNFDPAAYAP